MTEKINLKDGKKIKYLIFTPNKMISNKDAFKNSEVLKIKNDWLLPF